MPPKRHTVGPLSPQLQYAIEHYVDTRDPDRAAKLAGMEPKEFRRFMRHEDVAALIQKKLDLIDLANAQMRTQARALTLDKIDAELLQVFKFKGPKTLRERVKACEIAYKRHGALTEKHEHAGEGGGPLVFELVRLGGKKKPGNEGGDGGATAAAS